MLYQILSFFLPLTALRDQGGWKGYHFTSQYMQWDSFRHQITRVTSKMLVFAYLLSLLP